MITREERTNLWNDIIESSEFGGDWKEDLGPVEIGTVSSFGKIYAPLPQTLIDLICDADWRRHRSNIIQETFVLFYNPAWLEVSEDGLDRALRLYDELTDI